MNTEHFSPLAYLAELNELAPAELLAWRDARDAYRAMRASPCGAACLHAAWRAMAREYDVLKAIAYRRFVGA